MMHKSIQVKIPAEEKYIKLVNDAIDDICETSAFGISDIDVIKESVRELIINAIEHAYPDQKGYIEISIHPFETGIRLDVHDWGLPMSAKKHASVPLEKEASQGFNRIYALMDLFEYHNLGKEGKKFTIIKYLSHPLHKEERKESAQEREKHQQRIHPEIPVEVRLFREGDEEGIARLIYKNYGYSYIKDLFYYPQKVFESHGKKFYSIVAVTGERVIGHFALVLVPESTIAEIGVAVVDPEFQGMGIMNRMFKLVMQQAKTIGLDAIFGEAIMFHIYSQKANLSHGFSESALMLGKVPVDTTIVNNELAQKSKRGAVLIGYYFFTKAKKRLFLPKVYKKQIKRTYESANLPLKHAKAKKQKIPKHIFLSYTFDPPTNIAKIRIDRYGKDLKQKFSILLAQLKAKHCDMIYADISLERIPQIEKAIEMLNKAGFFYSGVMFLYHEGEDYLRLQLKHSDRIGHRNYVCYSDFCKKLSRYIMEDERRVQKG
jgi:anti-sigma regulatory factor (Ser/Thr protein kinase)/N-acetylglutamate synthase-like GNAT family acetyltransferase